MSKGHNSSIDTVIKLSKFMREKFYLAEIPFKEKLSE